MAVQQQAYGASLTGRPLPVWMTTCCGETRAGGCPATSKCGAPLVDFDSAGRIDRIAAAHGAEPAV
ncbi:hypothetical protein ABZ695_28835 [Streptomyces sp. NPDC006976]